MKQFTIITALALLFLKGCSQSKEFPPADEMIEALKNNQIVVEKNADGRLEAFARLKDGRIIHCWQDGKKFKSGWSNWELLGTGNAVHRFTGKTGDGQ